MKRLLIQLAVFAALVAATTQAVHAQTVNEPIARASLIADAPDQHLAEGKPVWIALKLQLPEGWHAYWQNPGDSGIPPEINIDNLPQGAALSPIHWPVPERIETSGLVNYGYSGTVILPLALTPPKGAVMMNLRAKASWLVCKEICIPESAELTLELPQTTGSAEIKAALAHVGVPQKTTLHFTREDDMIVITLPENVALGTNDRFAFFPLSEHLISNSAPIQLNGATLTATAQPSAPPKGEIAGLLDIRRAEGARELLHFSLPAKPSPPPVRTETSLPPAPILALELALALAFLGGILLNLMPCVLPILALKTFHLAGKSGKERAVVIRSGIAYTLGVLISMAALGLILTLIQAGGSAVGWGFQLQSTTSVALLALLMVLVAAYLLNMFHLPSMLGRLDASLGNHHGSLGHFFTGCLSVAVATPCTAPFMAPALGAAAALPPLEGLSILLSLGMGLAFPYLLICLWPAAQRLLPKPGAWMERFKQLLAFPMIATSLWLMWVLGSLAGAEGIITVLTSITLLGFIWWLARKEGGVLRLILRIVLSAFALALVFTIEPTHSSTSRAEIGGVRVEAYSQERLAELRASATPVLVDATADWCITCKVNERTSLHHAAVTKALREREAVFMIADWTRRDGAITGYLASFGRNGVPLVVWYAPGKEGVVLPQILTPSLVLAEIAK